MPVGFRAKAPAKAKVLHCTPDSPAHPDNITVFVNSITFDTLTHLRRVGAVRAIASIATALSACHSFAVRIATDFYNLVESVLTLSAQTKAREYSLPHD